MTAFLAKHLIRNILIGSLSLIRIPGFGQEAPPAGACEIYTSKNKRDTQNKGREIPVDFVSTHQLDKDSVFVIRYKYNSDVIEEAYYCRATSGTSHAKQYLIAEVIKRRKVKRKMIRVTDPDLKIYLLNCPD